MIPLLPAPFNRKSFSSPRANCTEGIEISRFLATHQTAKRRFSWYLRDFNVVYSLESHLLFETQILLATFDRQCV